VSDRHVKALCRQEETANMKTEETNTVENRIIEAARRVFVRKGYEATAMNDIAAEAGISRTAIHYYFRTKETMFKAIFAQLIDTIMPNIELIAHEPSTIMEKIPRIVDEYLKALRANLMFPLFAINEINRDAEHVFRVLVQEPRRMQPLMSLRMQLQDEMDRGLIRSMPPEDVVSALIGLIIFPILIRNILQRVFMEGKPEAFDEFLSRRRQLICKVMHSLLDPGENSNTKYTQV
jgi:AcrR family transcriptional regulator